MADVEGLADLVADLRALPAGQRRAVLGELSPSERSRLNLVLAAADTAGRALAHDPLAGFSPWVRARLAPWPGGAAAQRQPRMTSAGQQLLQQAVLEAGQPAPAPAPPGTLLGAMGDALLKLWPRR